MLGPSDIVLLGHCRARDHQGYPEVLRCLQYCTQVALGGSCGARNQTRDSHRQGMHLKPYFIPLVLKISGVYLCQGIGLGPPCGSAQSELLALHLGVIPGRIWGGAYEVLEIKPKLAM